MVYGCTTSRCQWPSTYLYIHVSPIPLELNFPFSNLEIQDTNIDDVKLWCSILLSVLRNGCCITAGVGIEAQEESGGLKGERGEERRVEERRGEERRGEERRGETHFELDMSGMIQIVISIFDILFVSHILPVL
jgi:hypothetical protein